MKPDIDNLITTIRRGKGHSVPLIELGIHPAIKERFLGRPVHTLSDEIRFWESAGYDYIKLQPVADFDPSGKKSIRTAQPESGNTSIQWAAEDKGIISSMDDFEKFVFPRKEYFDYSRFEQVKKLLPDGMGVIGQYGDIFTMTWELMGFETFSMALFDNPGLIKALNETVGNLVLSMFEYFARSDAVDILWYSDDIAYQGGLLMSPGVLQQYFFPWLKKIGDLARTSNKPFLYHSDGILYDVMEELIDCGVDALHPIEPQAMNLADVKKRFGDRLCLMGHVDVDLLCRGTREEVREQVRKNIETAAYDGGYCVGSGNSIPDYVNYDNYLALLEAARDFGNHVF
jgi:uroporphyrinogen decarboxylase